MASSATLKAALRQSAGKGTARKLRAAGQVPAVLYGHGEKPRPLAVNAHDLGLLIASVNVENTLVRLDIDGEGMQDVLLREVQMHAYKPEALHVDFFHVNAKETLHVKIPVRLRAKTKDGKEQKFWGEYTLRRSMVDGATAEQRKWRIYSAQLKELP